MKRLWQDSAWESYEYWQLNDRKILKKINLLLKDIDRNGYECSGHPEALKGDYSGYWSVHIDKKNRLIFKIEGDVIVIAECRSHYGDK